jgi:hypothetical protein
MKLLGIISVGFDVTDQLQIRRGGGVGGCCVSGGNVSWTRDASEHSLGTPPHGPLPGNDGLGGLH